MSSFLCQLNELFPLFSSNISIALTLTCCSLLHFMLQVDIEFSQQRLLQTVFSSSMDLTSVLKTMQSYMSVFTHGVSVLLHFSIFLTVYMSLLLCVLSFIYFTFYSQGACALVGGGSTPYLALLHH